VRTAAAAQRQRQRCCARTGRIDDEAACTELVRVHLFVVVWLVRQVRFDEVRIKVEAALVLLQGQRRAPPSEQQAAGALGGHAHGR
jgi:hypothetical protein